MSSDLLGLYSERWWNLRYTLAESVSIYLLKVILVVVTPLIILVLDGSNNTQNKNLIETSSYPHSVNSFGTKKRQCALCFKRKTTKEILKEGNVR